jgi:hypothetical protein
VKDCTEKAVEEALNNGSIVRSWPMRNTLHLTSPEDLGWMLDLLGSRAIAKSVTNQRSAGVTKRHLVKSRDIIERELQGKALDRNEVYNLLVGNGIKTSNTRGLHILGHLAREKVICFGARRGKQPTFVLFNEWIQNHKRLSGDEALAELSHRYFMSHGPATIPDFAWWSGLTKSEAARGVNMVQSQLHKVDDYWMPKGNILSDQKLNVRLLPAYDEFLVGYTDRSASEKKAVNKLRDRNSIFAATVIMNGHITGMWKRTIEKNGVTIQLQAFEKMSKQTEASLKREMRRYAKFIGMEYLP